MASLFCLLLYNDFQVLSCPQNFALMKVYAKNSQVCAEVFTLTELLLTPVRVSPAWLHISSFSSRKWKKDWNTKDKRKFCIFNSTELDWIWLPTSKTEEMNAKTIWCHHPHPKVVQEYFRRGDDDKAELSEMLAHPFTSCFSTIVGVYCYSVLHLLEISLNSVCYVFFPQLGNHETEVSWASVVHDYIKIAYIYIYDTICEVFRKDSLLSSPAAAAQQVYKADNVLLCRDSTVFQDSHLSGSGSGGKCWEIDFLGLCIVCGSWNHPLLCDEQMCRHFWDAQTNLLTLAWD